MFEDLNKDYNFLSKLREANPDQSQDLWEKRMFQRLNMLVTDGKIDPRKMAKFRANSALLSEVPRNPYSDNPIKKVIYKYLRFPGFRKSCYHNFNKLRLDETLIWSSFNEVGAPIYYETDGKKFNERFLRHLRTVSIIEKNIALSKDSLVVDIGGGFGQFLAMLNYKFSSAKKILVDFPEQLLVASYFLKKSFPNAKINTVRSCYDPKFSIVDMINDNDFILISTDQVHLLDDVKADLVCNFSSLGEMSAKHFETYINGSLINTSKYFFTINRLDSFPTYANGISILDYELYRFKKIHLSVSPVWDFYFTSFSPFWINKIAFKSRNFEFLGEKI